MFSRPAKAVAEAPQLAAARSHQKVQAAAVSELVGLLCGFSLDDGED